MNASSSPNADERSTLEALRAVTASLRDLPNLIRVVRSVYRAQDRKPQREPMYINWIERYVRFYQTKPLGMLDAAHVEAFLTHLARRPGMTPTDQDQALEAIRFLHNEVLQDDLGEIAGYTRAIRRQPMTSDEESETGHSLWDYNTKSK